MRATSVPLRQFLSRSLNWITPEPDQAYKQVTARLWGKGLKLRGSVLGSQVAARRQVQIREGQFLLSRIDARNGAFGLVPAALDGAIVSSDFPAFDVDQSQADSRYLEWYSKSRRFVELVWRASEGSTNRVRLKEERLLDMEVPLPPLCAQRQIAGRLDRVAALLQMRRQTLTESEREVAALLQRAFDKTIEGAGFRTMAEVAPLVRRPVQIDPDGRYPELGVRSFGRGTFHKPSVDGAALGTKKLFRIEARDLVFNIVFAWEGAVAVANEEDDGRFGSHRFLTCIPEPKTATADFLRYFFLTRRGLHVLGDASPGGAGRNRTLGVKKLTAIEVPVPRIEKQLWFDNLQAKAWALRTIREQGERDLDALIPAMLDEVFGTPDETRQNAVHLHRST